MRGATIFVIIVWRLGDETRKENKGERRRESRSYLCKNMANKWPDLDRLTRGDRRGLQTCTGPV